MEQTVLDLPAGEVEKASGLALVEMANQEFVDRMRAEAVRICDATGAVSTDDLRARAVALGIVPRHQNAWGAIFRGKAWRMVGRRKSAVPGNHAREIRVWSYAGGLTEPSAIC